MVWKIIRGRGYSMSTPTNIFILLSKGQKKVLLRIFEDWILNILSYGYMHMYTYVIAHFLQKVISRDQISKKGYGGPSVIHTK